LSLKPTKSAQTIAAASPNEATSGTRRLDLDGRRACRARLGGAFAACLGPLLALCAPELWRGCGLLFIPKEVICNAGFSMPWTPSQETPGGTATTQVRSLQSRNDTNWSGRCASERSASARTLPASAFGLLSSTSGTTQEPGTGARALCGPAGAAPESRHGEREWR
jgi:hypothetical protein